MFTLHAVADFVPTYSSREMVERSLLIFDGEVLEIEQLGAESIPVEGGAPVIVNNYQGRVQVTTIRKGALGNEQMKTMEIFVRWKNIKDARFRGERGPDVKVGEKHTFYVEAVGKDTRGEPVPYLQGSNNLGVPESTEAIRTPLPSSASAGDNRAQPPTINPATVPSPVVETKSPETVSPDRQKMYWALAMGMVLCVAVIGGTLLRRRRNTSTGMPSDRDKQ